MKAPTLKELKTRACTLEELQEAIVKLIEIHNDFVDTTIDEIFDDSETERQKQLNTPYGL